MNKEELFNELKTQHPEWSDDQIWTHVSVMIPAGDVISEYGPNPPAIEQILGVILEKAKLWLLETLPDVFSRVASFFDEMISSLPDWAKKGIGYVFKMIVSYYTGNNQYTY